MSHKPTLSAIYCYPVKSCAGTVVMSTKLDTFGLSDDRRWMVVEPDGKFLTQRTLPKMALIHPQVLDQGLRLEAPDMPAISIPALSLQSPTRRVSVWKSTCEAADAGNQVAQWLSDFLETDCRLVGIDKRFKRQVNPDFSLDNDSVSFADGYPFLLTNNASLEDLNQRLTTPVPMDRFRPNLVVSGALPFAEDDWQRIKIGEIVFHVVKPCARCVVTTVDQASAQQGEEPLTTLATYRKGEHGEVLFGQNLIHAQKWGQIHVGDTIEMLA